MVNVFDILLPHYDYLAPKVKNWLRQDLYYTYLLAADLEMFQYNGLPEDVNPRFLEIFLCCFGSALLAPHNDGYILCPMPSLTGQLDQYGDGIDFEGITADGVTKTGKVDQDGVILYNNKLRTPEIDNQIDSGMFAAVDTSTDINVHLARVAPCFFGQTSVQNTQIEEMLKNIADGQMFSVTSKGTFDGLRVGTEAIQTFEPTSPERAQYIQYLSEYWDQVQRRHFARRGLAAKTSTKHAQVTTDEVHGLDCVSWYYPLSKLKQRQEDWQKINEIFGLSVTVEFSEIWQQEYDAYTGRLDLEIEGSDTEQAEEPQEEGVNDAGEEEDQGNDSV